MIDTRGGFDAYGTTGSSPPTSVPRRSPRLAVMGAWREHGDLLGNAGSLLATTGVTSALGFAFWALAARLFSQRVVGYGVTATSAMTLLGTIGMLGLGTMLIGELPRRTRAAGLVSAALLASGLGSLVLGLGFAIVAPHASGQFDGIFRTPGQAALFATGVVLSGMTFVFDQATIGLLRGGLQLSRNLAFAFAKLLVLPATAIFLHNEFGAGISLSWVTGIAVSLLPVAIRLRFTGAPILPRPDWGVLRELGKTALAHNWLNLAIGVPGALIPVLVTVVVSPSASAAFYAAWMLASFLFFIPAHLSTVLFAVAAADPEALTEKLRFALRVALWIGLPAMAALCLGAHLVLSMFGAGYADAATLPLWLLVICYLPSIPKCYYIAVCRAAGKLSRAAVVLATFAAAEVAAAAVGGASGGLIGLSYALLGVSLLEALVTTPAVVRVAIGHGRHRRTESVIAATGNPARNARPLGIQPVCAESRPPVQGQLRYRCPARAAPATMNGPITPVLSEARKRDRQEAGLAVLLSLARSAAQTVPIPAVRPDRAIQPAVSVRESTPAPSHHPAPSDRWPGARSAVSAEHKMTSPAEPGSGPQPGTGPKNKR